MQLLRRRLERLEKKRNPEVAFREPCVARHRKNYKDFKADRVERVLAERVGCANVEGVRR